MTLADSDIDREENGEKAVYWYILASRQGNREATTVLQKCKKNKTGTGRKFIPVKVLIEHHKISMQSDVRSAINEISKFNI